MPQPTISDVHVDAILTNISVAYMQKAENMIADKVFPVVPVDKKSNKYFTYDKADWFRDEAQRRAPGTESAGGGYNLSTDTYAADVWAFHKDVDDQTVANADTPLNPLREAAEFVTSRLLLRREVQFITDFMTTGVWDNEVTGVTSSPVSGTSFYQWSDYSNSDPIEDIETAKEDILSTTGYEGNTLVLGYQTFRQLKNHPDIVDRYKYTTSSVITEEMMARLFGVDRILVAKSVRNSAAEGLTASYGFNFGKAACLLHVAPNPGLMTPSAGYIFAWTGVSGGLGSTIGTSQFRMESLKAARVEAEVAFDNKVVANDLGYFFNSAVA
jgi:hypothetical protein